mgnify:CR=1 FL=1
MIEVINLQKSFGDNKVLDGIDMNIEKGEIVVVIGPSGSGKSTFLRCLNCMEDPTGGQIIFNGVDIADPKVDINVHRRHMGMVFQHFNLFNNKTVLQNIMLAPVYVRTHDKIEKKSKRQIVEEAKQEALELLDRIGLRDKADVYPSTLSGGQKQRVAIARAMANNPSIILADEPTGALDSKTGRKIMDIFHKLHKEQGKTIVLITHSQELAEETERILTLKDGEIVAERGGSRVC